MASGKLREIERLRGLAALATVFVHWKFMDSMLAPLLRDPESGVDLFFVISGFVVTSSLLRHLPDVTAAPDFLSAFDTARQALRTFYARRFFRILPAALTLMLVQRLAIDYFPIEFGTALDWQKEVVSFLSGVYNFYIAQYSPDKFSVYWSLSVEEQFYLFLPILFIALRTNSRRFGAAAFIIVFIPLVVRTNGDPSADVFQHWYRLFSSQFRFDSLMAGTALALLWPKQPSQPFLPRNFVRFGVVPVVTVLLFALPLALPEYVWFRAGLTALWGLSAILVAYAAADRGYVYDFPVVRWVLEKLGARSYALYLVHFSMLRLDRSVEPLWPAYGRFVADHNPWAHFAVLFAATLVVTELMHQLIERPFLHVGTAVTSTGSERAVPQWMRGALVALGVVLVLFPLRHAIASVFRPKDIARGATVTASSRSSECPDPSVMVDGYVGDEGRFCTDPQDKPWIEIDLKTVQPLGWMLVYNRVDGAFDEQLPLEATISKDGRTWLPMGTRTTMFTSGHPWQLSLPEGAMARYVRFSVHRKTRLSLSEVEIFARTPPPSVLTLGDGGSTGADGGPLPSDAGASEDDGGRRLLMASPPRLGMPFPLHPQILVVDGGLRLVDGGLAPRLR